MLGSLRVKVQDLHAAEKKNILASMQNIKAFVKENLPSSMKNGSKPPSYLGAKLSFLNPKINEGRPKMLDNTKDSEENYEMGNSKQHRLKVPSLQASTTNIEELEEHFCQSCIQNITAGSETAQYLSREQV